MSNPLDELWIDKDSEIQELNSQLEETKGWYRDCLEKKRRNTVMDKWEYQVLRNLSGDELDEYGMQGWELITVVRVVENLGYYFKRRLVDETTDKE